MSKQDIFTNTYCIKSILCKHLLFFKVPKMKSQLAILTYLLSVSVGQECGNPAVPPKPSNAGERIINGEEAIPHSFPWMVSIEVGSF